MSTPATLLSVDTCYIMEVYLQRPQNLAHLSFGQWFSYCHDLKDTDLQQSASGQLTKKLICEKGYNLLPLEVLKFVNDKARKHGNRN